MSLPNLRGPDQNWRQLAACRGLDVNLFIPEGTGNGKKIYDEARIVCAGCPVRAACLEHAIRNGETMGMWGGLIPAERKKLGGKAVVAHCKICGGRFSRAVNSQRYCSDDCRDQRRLGRRRPA